MENKQTEAQRIEQAIENFVLKMEHKMPKEIHSACTSANVIISKAEILLNNAVLVDFTKIVPSTEPAREAILGILATLGKCFSAVDASMQSGLIASAGWAVSAAIHGSGATPESFASPYITVAANANKN